ncbi:MAG TPA: DUF4296 domain-containing protein [Bacteroidales bacterium]|nr:DUF4296 domain-containing protein [Bacteroidales bacterium]
MKKLLVILVIVLTLAGCSEDKRAQIPPQVIPPERMVQVLVDFHLAEASLACAGPEGRDVGLLRDQYYYFLLRKHHISYKEFNESLQYYSSNLKELHLIYGEVVTELSKTQSKIGSKKTGIIPKKGW